MRVSINRAVVARGTSGSARGVAHIESSLVRLGHDVEPLNPRPLRASRVWNAAYQAYWDLVQAPRSAKSLSAEVHISPTNVGRGSGKAASLVLIHDTMVLDRPDLFDQGYGRYARLLFSLSASAADVVMCPSHYTADRLRERWPKIPFVQVAWWPIAVSDESPARRDGFLVTVLGATEPHKRQTVAIESVARARAESGEDFKLAVVGPEGRAETDVRDALARFDPDGAWASRMVDVPQETLDTVLSETSVLLQPSVFEGFGLPVSEASAKGIPVVHSGAGSLAEIAPSAALAFTVEEFSEAIRHLAEPASWSIASAAAREDARRLSFENFDAKLSQAIQIAAAARR